MFLRWPSRPIWALRPNAFSKGRTTQLSSPVSIVAVNRSKDIFGSWCAQSWKTLCLLLCFQNNKMKINARWMEICKTEVVQVIVWNPPSYNGENIMTTCTGSHKCDSYGHVPLWPNPWQLKAGVLVPKQQPLCAFYLPIFQQHRRQWLRGIVRPILLVPTSQQQKLWETVLRRAWQLAYAIYVIRTDCLS